MREIGRKIELREKSQAMCCVLHELRTRNMQQRFTSRAIDATPSCCIDEITIEPAETPNARAQFLILTLFGDYILPRGGTIWTTSLLALLDLLGVGERAARSALSRMSGRGWLVARKQGRRSQYTLTAQGRTLLEQGERRLFEPPSPTGIGCGAW
jgi:hypothetical protein